MQPRLQVVGAALWRHPGSQLELPYCCPAAPHTTPLPLRTSRAGGGPRTLASSPGRSWGCPIAARQTTCSTWNGASEHPLLFCCCCKMPARALLLLLPAIPLPVLGGGRCRVRCCKRMQLGGWQLSQWAGPAAAPRTMCLNWRGAVGGAASPCCWDEMLGADVERPPQHAAGCGRAARAVAGGLRPASLERWRRRAALPHSSYQLR